MTLTRPNANPNFDDPESFSSDAKARCDSRKRYLLNWSAQSLQT
jgi:hypothetical protein